MNRFTRQTLIVGAVVLVPLAAWAFLPMHDDEPSNVSVSSSHVFDGLNRVTSVERNNGHSLSYELDAAGNIEAVRAVGRSSAKLKGRLVRGES